MYNYIISIAFLGITVIPIFILFLTFIKELGEDLRRGTVMVREKGLYENSVEIAGENYHEKIRRVK
ncbi:hypothetical protein SAMN05660297_01789 [Natronincola peptidivorans]|uniref:Uncharacterized protein n=1 Tax=Natronincola peptidivorans TaxID=426128 RepID=A0A1I0CW13_9FIRM|nr:hypothetical protein [Natronincola peptidivorans]SET23839.1 hypothetical protein SAMN05660297_01789 [Natronincola peptidivorans]